MLCESASDVEVVGEASNGLDAVRRAADGDSPFSTPVLRRLVDQAVRSRPVASNAAPPPRPDPARA
ncbi:MAG TPA: hypothetical protein VGP31_06875 [Planosporangium sp.]|jgi:hypothetical protein|nr:hypothetical protein [Planosporangium sp.]